MAIIKKLAATKRGFTLIELMIVVVIIGVLAAMAIYGVNKYVANAKSAEGRTILGRISKDAVKAAEGEAVTAGILTLGTSAQITRRICGSGPDSVPTGATLSATAPAAPADVKGKKYQADASLYRNNGTANTGFRCLGTEVIGPTYYAFGYTAADGADGATALAVDQTFTGWAVGDLDGDDNASAMWIDGKVQAGTSNNLTITLNPTIGEFAVEE